MSCVILLRQRKKCETRNRFKKENSFWGFCYALSSKYMENMNVSAAARVTSVKKFEATGHSTLTSKSVSAKNQ